MYLSSQGWAAFVNQAVGSAMHTYRQRERQQQELIYTKYYYSYKSKIWDNKNIPNHTWKCRNVFYKNHLRLSIPNMKRTGSDDSREKAIYVRIWAIIMILIKNARIFTHIINAEIFKAASKIENSSSIRRHEMNPWVGADLIQNFATFDVDEVAKKMTFGIKQRSYDDPG